MLDRTYVEQPSLALNERTNAHLQDGLSLRFYDMGLLRRCDPLVSVSIQQSCCRGLGKLVFSSPRYRGTLYGRCGALPFFIQLQALLVGSNNSAVALVFDTCLRSTDVSGVAPEIAIELDMPVEAFLVVATSRCL